LEVRLKNFKRSSIGFLLAVVFISACSGGSGDSAGTFPNSTIQQTSGGDFSAIAGVWDESVNHDGVIDSLYWVINADGTYADVDYRGDDHNNDEHCYDYYTRGIVTADDTADGYIFERPPSNNTTVLLTPDTINGNSTVDVIPDQFSVLHHLRVINGELARLDGSNGSPVQISPPVPGGLDPSIPEC